MTNDYRRFTREEEQTIFDAFIGSGHRFEGQGSILLYEETSSVERSFKKILRVNLDMGASDSIPLKPLPGLADKLCVEMIYVNGTLAYDKSNPPAAYYFM